MVYAGQMSTALAAVLKCNSPGCVYAVQDGQSRCQYCRILAGDLPDWKYFRLLQSGVLLGDQDDADADLLSPNEAAAILGWPAERVYRAVYRGVLPDVGDGYAVRIPRADLRDFMAARAQHLPEPAPHPDQS